MYSRKKIPRSLLWLIATCCLFMVAPASVYSVHADRLLVTDSWQVENYNNATLSGTSFNTTTVSPDFRPTVDENWLSTASVFKPYSTRWTTTFNLTEPTHLLFQLYISGGNNSARVLVDGRTIVSDALHDVATDTALFQAGNHQLVVEFQHVAGVADFGLYYATVAADEAFHVRHFSLSPNPISLDTETATIRWDVEGVNTVTLKDGHNWYWNLPTSGEKTITYRTATPEEHARAYIPTWQSAGVIGLSGNVTVEIDIRCTADSWFFNNPFSHCPWQRPDAIPMKIQQFERGLMIWEGASNRTVAFFQDERGNGRKRTELSTRWSASTPEDSNPTQTAPNGLIKPLNQFGELWTNRDVQTHIGWAISEPQSYSGFHQCAGHCYYATPTNLVYMDVSFQPRFGLWPEWETITSPMRYPRDVVDGSESTPIPPTAGEPCPTFGVWPAGCNPNLPPTSPAPPKSDDGEPCPQFGVWPAGCNPTLTPSSPTPPTDGRGEPCPASGVWPTGCNPNLKPPTSPSPPVDEVTCPASGVWPIGCNPNLPPQQPRDETCVIPPYGPWPECAR